MTLWQRTKQFFGGFVRKSRVFRSILHRTGMMRGFEKGSWTDYAKDGPEKNPYVASVIDNIQTSCASIPPRLYRITDGGQTASVQEGYERKAHSGHFGRQKKRRAALTVIRKETKRIREETGLSMIKSKERAMKALLEQGELELIEGHELIALLDRPNPWYQKSYADLIKAIVGGLELGGESYIEPIFPSSTAQMPREVYVHEPDNVTFKSQDRARQPIEEVRLENTTFRYSPDPTESEIWYMKYWHPRSGLRGLSPVEAAARSIDINNEGRGWNLSLLRNGAEISGILSFEEGMGEEARSRIEQQFKESVEPGDVIKADGSKFSFEQLSMSPKDMQWKSLSNMSAKEVSITWNVPPEITGFDESKTFANYETANRVYHRSKIVPLMDFVFGELNSTLVPLFGDDLLLDYDTSGVKALQEEEDALHERLREDVAQGLLTINEARDRIGMDEVEGGDILLIPSTSVPLTAVGASSASERAAEMMPELKSDVHPLLTQPPKDQLGDLVQIDLNGESE